MADPVELLLQGAIVTRLKADSGVDALVGDSIYDRPPDSPAFPYVTVEVTQVIDEQNTCAVMKRPVFYLHCWSRKPGRVEVQRIAGAVETAIRSSALTATGHQVSLQYQEGTRYMTDADGLTSHAIVTFEFETTPTA